jgi:hypothetical protein
LFERRVQRIGGGARRVHHGVPRSVGGSPCFFAGGARRLGCDPCLLAGNARSFSGVPQLLSVLSDCFERLAMMVANFTRFLCESPELFRLIPGVLRGYAVCFRNPTDLGLVPAVIHEITYRQCTGGAVQEMSSTEQVRHSCVKGEGSDDRGLTFWKASPASRTLSDSWIRSASCWLEINRLDRIGDRVRPLVDREELAVLVEQETSVRTSRDRDASRSVVTSE